MNRLTVVVLAAALLGCRGEAASPPPSVVRVAGTEVALTGRVVDQAQILPATDEIAITESLQRLEKDTTDQLVVVTLPNLKGATIETVGRTLGDRWGIGRSDVDNGVLLLVAPNDRQVRIEVGLGLEGLLTNQRSAEIVQHMLPSFRANRPVDAIKAGVREISEVLERDRARPRYLKAKAA